MDSKSSLPSTYEENVPVLHIGRAYNARDAAAILGISESVLNERVREGVLQPIFSSGDRRYSGYVLARLMGWPVSEDPSDYLPKERYADSGVLPPQSRRRRRLAARA